MRSLLPEATNQVDLVETYSRELRLPDGRPFVRVNMVSTLDGAIALGGRAGQISGPADRSLFFALRSLADLVLVGAGTARAENYGPVKLAEDVQHARLERGQSPLPRLAVVTHRVDLDFGSRLFLGSSPRPIIIAPGGAHPGALAKARLVADVLATATETVDLPAALSGLGDLGIRHILCEGGPTLNESLVAASLVDEPVGVVDEPPEVQPSRRRHSLDRDLECSSHIRRCEGNLLPQQGLQAADRPAARPVHDAVPFPLAALDGGRVRVE